MKRRLTGETLGAGRESDLPAGFGESRFLLSTLYKSSTVGVAICDRQLRFRAINDALASMNGLPAAAHIGKTLHAVLGNAAAKIEPAFEHVFKTGQPLYNVEVTAKLRERASAGHWSEHYFPLADARNKVHHVGAVVLELSRREKLDALVSRVTRNLVAATSTVRSSSTEPPVVYDGRQGECGTSLANSLAKLLTCLRDMRLISELLSTAPAFQAVQPRRDLAAMTPVENSLDFMDPLSPREREVLAWLAAGKGNKEVSDLLSISVRTVETHRSKIMLKLRARSLSELVRYAVRRGLVNL